jgi:hypothetical protein
MGRFLTGNDVARNPGGFIGRHRSSTFHTAMKYRSNTLAAAV